MGGLPFDCCPHSEGGVMPSSMQIQLERGISPKFPSSSFSTPAAVVAAVVLFLKVSSNLDTSAGCFFFLLSHQIELGTSLTSTGDLFLLHLSVSITLFLSFFFKGLGLAWWFLCFFPIFPFPLFVNGISHVMSCQVEDNSTVFFVDCCVSLRVPRRSIASFRTFVLNQIDVLNSM